MFHWRIPLCHASVALSFAPTTILVHTSLLLNRKSSTLFCSRLRLPSVYTLYYISSCLFRIISLSFFSLLMYKFSCSQMLSILMGMCPEVTLLSHRKTGLFFMIIIITLFLKIIIINFIISIIKTILLWIFIITK